MSQELEITTMSEKGQIVIPQLLRKEMGLKAKTRFIVMRKGDFIMMKALQMPDMNKEWNSIFKKIDEKNLRISDKEIASEVKKYRKAKRKK
ncbi:MAG: AbrB/MazE/SpoVT family DNA-binding domain-containing protein [Thaumarchaeota archaeon]|nr:AbrB/MazE/SpoVT family DNA-binding domain-containing protein [Nitrososphaerota archaeon]